MSEEEPQYTHDCDRCTFLGRYVAKDWNDLDVDLYVCTRSANSANATVIARYGDEGAEYGSGLSFCASADQYAEACRRAINGGHLDETLNSGNAAHVDHYDEEHEPVYKTLAQLMDEYFGEGEWRESVA